MQSLPCKVALLSILLAFCVNSQGLPFYFDPIGSINAWSPLNLGSTVKMFLVDSALPDSGNISRWTDSGTYGLNATNATTLQQPSVLSINGIKSASFNGISSFLVVPPFSVSNSVAMFMVARSSKWKVNGTYTKMIAKGDADSQTDGIVWSFNGINNQDWLAYDMTAFGRGYGASSYPRIVSPTTITNGQTCILNAILSATQSALFINGTQTSPRVSVPAAVPLSTSGMRICVNAFSINNQYFGADIFCIIFIQDDLSVSNRQKLEGWAAWRYGLQSELPVTHPYKNMRP